MSNIKKWKVRTREESTIIVEAYEWRITERGELLLIRDGYTVAIFNGWLWAVKVDVDADPIPSTP